MDRYFGLLLIVALLFPSGLPRPGQMCAAMDPAQLSCCCEPVQNLASAEDRTPRMQKQCCCDVKAPEPGQKPVPAVVVQSDLEWSAPPLAAASAAALVLPQPRAHWTAQVGAPRGPPGDLYRRFCVIRC